MLLSFPVYAAKNLLIVGDSLSAGYGLEEDKSWVTLLKFYLTKNQLDYNLINASISGETTSGGLSRLPTLLTQYKPSILIIELGANDGLQGHSIQQITKNLQKMVALATAHHCKILLVGIRIPDNYGLSYTQRFARIFKKIPPQPNIITLPNLLEGIDENPAMFQEDGLHPNDIAQPLIVNNVWQKIKKLL